MRVYQVVLFLFSAGLVGGIVNAFLESEGFILPGTDALVNGRTIWRPGFVGNVAVGGIVALIMAGFYSPLGAEDFLAPAHLDLRALAGALISGIGGARLLTQEINRRYDQWTKAEMNETIQSLNEPREK